MENSEKFCGCKQQRTRQGMSFSPPSTLASLLLMKFLLTLAQVIPRTVMERAAGFAIFTVFKAGFLFSARAGSGVVVARLPDGSE